MPGHENESEDPLESLFSGMFDTEERKAAPPAPNLSVIGEYDPITVEDVEGLGDIANVIHVVELTGLTIAGMVLYACTCMI